MVQHHFTPKASEETYYKIKTPAVHHESALYTTFVQPWYPPIDKTHGRFDLPFSPRERHIRDNKKYTTWDGRAFLNESKTEWIFYQVWEAKQPSKQPNADMVLCHGINDYGGKWSEHAEIFLDAGYRMIAPDLPSHGRSTGLHTFVTNMESVAEGVDAVICDVAIKDMKDGRSEEEIDSRKRFVVGASMGGFTALLYTIQYPPAPVSEAAESAGIRKTFNGVKRPRITGALLLCPMLEIAAESRPSKLVEYFARAIAHIAGRLPLAAANRGKGSRDAAVEEEFELDPQTYSGKLRISTGLACLKGIEMVNARLHEVNLPFKVLHGTGDRVTNYRGSQRLFDSCSSRDKEIKLYPGDEHILLRTGRDAVDDAKRQTILQDMLEWLDRH